MAPQLQHMSRTQSKVNAAANKEHHEPSLYKLLNSWCERRRVHSLFHLFRLLSDLLSTWLDFCRRHRYKNQGSHMPPERENETRSRNSGRVTEFAEMTRKVCAEGRRGASSSVPWHARGSVPAELPSPLHPSLDMSVLDKNQITVVRLLIS